jgi:transcriptional regulator with XRE-family HTH domain
VTTDKEQLQARIAEWILQVQRDSGGISLRELAKRAGIPSTTITAAARGEAGVGLHIALYRLAKVWPGGTYLDANRAWFGEDEPTAPAPAFPARRALDEDAEVAINASLDQMRAAIGALQGLMDRVAEVSAQLQDAVSSLETKRLADIEQRLQKLGLENGWLKAQLGVRDEVTSPEDVDMSPETLQETLKKLKIARGPKGTRVSAAKLETSED